MWQQLIAHLRQTLESQIVSGGILLIITTSLVALSRNTPRAFWSWLKRQIIIQVDIINNDPLFDSVALFLDKHPYSLRCRSLTAQMKHSEERALNQHTPHNSTQRIVPRILFTPAPGHHIFRFRGRRVWLWRVRKDAMEATQEALRGPVIEYFHIRMFGRRQERMRELLEAARQCTIDATRGRCEIYSSNYGQWVRLAKINRRTFASLVFPSSILEKLTEDVREFLESRQWYGSLGIPYRRGYLLHGVMGSGKTSIIEAIAHEFNIPLYILNVGGTMMTDERLNELLIAVPPGSIVLIEEVDAAVSGERVISADSYHSVTFQGLLQALDGITAREGCMVFMTTNHLDRLNSRLIRDGRVDVKIEFKHATREQCERLFKRFYPQAEASLTNSFADALGDREVAMSTVQKILVDHKQNPSAALLAARESQQAPRSVAEEDERAA
jgi:chaperone BCS1